MSGRGEQKKRLVVNRSEGVVTSPCCRAQRLTLNRQTCWPRRFPTKRACFSVIPMYLKNHDTPRPQPMSFRHSVRTFMRPCAPKNTGSLKKVNQDRKETVSHESALTTPRLKSIAFGAPLPSNIAYLPFLRNTMLSGRKKSWTPPSFQIPCAFQVPYDGNE